MKTPNHLQHRPLIAVDFYSKIDGAYANNTDAKALSLGRAQYDNDEISLKIFRHTGQKWSRQSEELPPHRVLDLAILFMKSLHPDRTNISGKPLFNEREMDSNALNDIRAYYNNNKKFLEPRLKEMKNILDKLV